MMHVEAANLDKCASRTDELPTTGLGSSEDWMLR
jgi:hypothetical protein